MGSDPPLDSDILVPADVDGDLIEWDGNDGHLNGILHEVGKYYERKTLFKPLFENRAVVVKGGKLAVDSIQAYKFIAGLDNDPRSYDDPCPPTAKRITEYSARRTASAKPVFDPITKEPDSFSSGYIVSKYSVENELGRLLTSLTHVIKNANCASALIDRGSSRRRAHSPITGHA